MNPLRLPRLNRPDHRSSAEVKDRVVQQTDQDASQSRLSAVETGYLQDPFAKLFVTGETQKRYPLINRGKKGKRENKPHPSTRPPLSSWLD
jgi:[phosphatase 2A protein]-leucine-carboxy methyltransferase